MHKNQVEQIKSGTIEASIHEKLVAARASRSIIVTDDTPREEIPAEVLAMDYERWDGLS